MYSIPFISLEARNKKKYRYRGIFCIASGTIKLYSHEMKQNLLLAKCHPRKKNLLHMNWSSLYCFSGEFLFLNGNRVDWFVV